MKTITILPILFLTFAQAVVQANLTFGPIRQCEPVTVSFQSNSLPAGTSADLSTTSLTILPLGLPPVVFPFTPRLTGTANSLVLAALPFPAQTRFLASLTDQLGKPLSKVSALMTIGASTSGGNTTCLVARPTERMFALLENPAQCSDFTVWYNTSTSSTSATSSTSTTTTTSSSTTATATSTGDARRPDPPRVRVYTPEGVELLLNNTSNNVTGEDGMARYTMSITAGQKVILMYDSGNGVREVTDLITVSGSSTSPSECLQAERDALAALSPSSDPNTVTRPSNAIIIGAASGGAAVLIIALAMTFFIVRDRRQRAAQQERRERVIRRVRSMSFSGQGSGRGMRGNTFLFPRPVRSSTFPGPNQAWGNDTQEEKVEESGSQNEPAAKGLSKQPSYSNHPYAFSPRSSRSSYILVDRPSSPSNPYDSSQQLPLERDASYQSRPSLGAQSEERNIPPIRFSRHGYGYEDPDRLSLTSLDIEGMLNMAQVQEDSGRSREGSIPTIMPDRRPGLEESRTSSENVVPKVPSAEVSITLPVDESNNASGSTVAFGRPTAIKLPARPEPPLLRTRSRRTLKVNSDIPDGVFSATNSFISSAGDELGTGNDSDSMAGWSPVYPSTYFRSSAYPTQPVSPDLEEGPSQIPSSSAPAPSESTSGLPSEASSFTKRIMAPFPETRLTPTSQSQPALASSFSVLPQRTSSPPPTISSRKASTESSASMQNVTLRGSMRDSTASGYAFPSPSAFPSPPSSIPTVQYPYRPPLQSAGSSSTFRSLPSVTTSFSQPSAATTTSFGQQSAAVSSGVTYTTGASTYAPSPSEGGVFSPSSVPTLPAYSPLRDPPPFSALSPPSDSVLSSMWSGRPMLSPLVESEPSPSPVSGSSSIQTGLRSLSPLVTSGLGKQGSIRSSQLSMSPASVRLAARGDVRDVRVDASERDMKRDIGTRKTPGGSLPVNYSGLPANPRGNMRRGGSVSTVMGANETLSRQPSTIGEEFYGIAR